MKAMAMRAGQTWFQILRLSVPDVGPWASHSTLAHTSELALPRL